MKLYRAKVPAIAKEILEVLTREGDIIVDPQHREEAAKDLIAIMEDFLRQDNEFRNRIKDDMARRGMSYDQFGQAQKELAEQTGHPLRDEVERFFCRQFLEMLMNSPNVEEVFGEDKNIYKKIMTVLRSNDVDESQIRAEAQGRIKNVREGTMEYEVAMQNAMRDVRKKHGLLDG